MDGSFLTDQSNHVLRGSFHQEQGAKESCDLECCQIFSAKEVAKSKTRLKKYIIYPQLKNIIFHQLSNGGVQVSYTC